MTTSPLELYENAYRLHYTEHRIAAAVDLYKQLIKEFPDANECGYAAIQLQKIRAQNVAASFSDTTHAIPEKKTNLVLLICVLLSIGSILFSVYLYRSLAAQRLSQKKHASAVMNALGKFALNEPEEALLLLGELKKIDPKAIAPYELSAYILRKQHKYSEARDEYATYFKNNPDKKPSPSESTYMTYTGTSEKRHENIEPPPAPLAGQTSLSPAVRKSVIPKRNRPGKNPPPPGPIPKSTAKKKKSIYLVDPDSVSYF